MSTFGACCASEFACGIIDHPTQKSVVDVLGGLETARKIEESSAVLLKNEGGVLPLRAASLKSIAVIGPHADAEMISGGGSAQVDAPGRPNAGWQAHVWFPTSPMKAVQAHAPHANVEFGSGANVGKAVALAKKSDVAIVFVYEWMAEGMDLENLTLPEKQDELIAAVAKANPKTIVVLETGTAVTMPWVDHVSGVLEAWYAGSDGANAVANILFGDVNPSARLPMTFPKSDRGFAASETRATGTGAERRSGCDENGRSEAHVQRELRRRAEGRIQVVRRGEKGGAVSVRTRIVVHDVRLFGVESCGRSKGDRRFVHGEKHGVARWCGNRASVRGVACGRGRAAEAIGWMEQSQA